MSLSRKVVALNDSIEQDRGYDSCTLSDLELGQSVAVSLVDKDSTGYHIEYANRCFIARRAISCLLEPEISDFVLVNFVKDSSGTIIPYILSILERQAVEKSVVNLPDKVAIVANQSIDICTPEYSQVAEKSHFFSDQLIHRFKTALVEGREMVGNVDDISNLSDRITTMAKQVIQTFGSYIRKTKVADHVSAAQMFRKVDGLYNVNSKHTIMISEKDTKIDGDHIHMG